MTYTIHALFIVISLFLAMLSYGMGRSVPQEIYRVSDGTGIPLETMMRDLESVELVFVGELHSNESHHRAQLEVIRSLNHGKKPVVVALEMFRKDHQKALDLWIAGEIGEQEFKEVFLSYWHFPWTLYRDIFIYSRKHKIPLIGLNVSPEITRQVAKEGFGSLTPAQKGELPNVGCVIEPEYEAFIRRAYSFHHHEGVEFTYFCEAQLVWDTAMAWNLIAAADKWPGRIVVVLAGNGHAWKHGIPRQIVRERELSYRVVLPGIPGRLEPEDVKIQEADYLWLHR